jgi:hypothetical protein
MGFNIEEYAKKTNSVISSMNEMVVEIGEKVVNQVGKDVSDMKKEIQLLINNDKLRENELQVLKGVIEDTGTKIGVIEEKVDGFDILSHPKYRVEFNALKKAVHSRILFLFNNDKSNCEYILFKPFYSSWLYSDLNDTVGAGSSACLYMGDNQEKYRAYLVCIKEWRPSKYNIEQACKDYMKKYNKKKNGLTGEKRFAWEEYLKKTNGGLD